jgi:hypothetical protein
MGAGPIGAASGYIGNALVNSNVGRRALANGTIKAGNKLTEKGTKKASKAFGPKAVTTRVGGVGLVDALAGQSLDKNSSQNPITSTTNTNIPTTANISGEYTNSGDLSTPEAANPFGVSKADIFAAMKDALAQGNTKAFSSLKDLYDIVAEEEKNSLPSAGKPLNQNQQDRADLIKAMGMAESSVNAGSINYGPLGSRLEGLKSTFNAADPETLAFKNTISGLRAAITKARAGASLTAGELALLSKYTPSDTDSEQVVRSKLAQLRALYGDQLPTGGQSLTDVLAQLQ